MNSNMLAHDAVQRNVELLAARGVRFVEPGEGYLACGWIGKGRLAEPPDIVAAAQAMLVGTSSELRNRHVVVTAGPTYEDIDAVRYVGNRSSGRMGFAVAAEAKRRGARVTLIAGPTPLDPPAADSVVRVRSASEMHAAVTRAAANADVVVMAAAVADYTPAAPSAHKIPKSDEAMTLRLERTPDILAALGRARAGGGVPVLVGFAAETGNAAAKARDKRVRKGADLMVANDVSEPDAGFEVDTNAVTLIDEEGEQALPVMAKDRVAVSILDRVERLLRTRAATAVRA
jgi:phosphopantothenoylcysteine decarboxylase/phosphopantothenate--cysteine ligase